jgi:hypothetical protein
MLKNMIISQFNDKLNIELNKGSDNTTVFNYINMLSALDKSLCSIAKESLITIFEALDKGYSGSSDRKKNIILKLTTKDHL